jgi:hypothetical protein
MSITKINEYNPNKLSFSKISTVKGNGFNFEKMYANYDVQDNENNKLLFVIEDAMCFGIRSFSDSKTLSICLTDEQTLVLDSLAERVSEHLLENGKDSVRTPYYRPEDGEKQCTLSLKLHPDKKNGGVQAGFYNSETDEQINPSDLAKHFKTTVVVQLDSVYISNKCTKLSFSLQEALVHAHEEQQKRRFLIVKVKE